MNNRHVDTLPRTTYLKDTDFLITEEDSLLRKISVKNIEKMLLYSVPLNSTPDSYSGYQIRGGKSVYSKRGLHFAVKSLIEAAYGSTGVNKKLKLYVFSTIFQEAIFETVETTTTATFTNDSSVVSFSENDWEAYDVFLISPWGLVPGTETFVDSKPLGSVSPEFAATHSDSYAVAATSLSGTVEIGTIDPAVEYPFAVLYKDTENYIKLFLYDNLVWIELIAQGTIRQKTVPVPVSPFSFSMEVDPDTGECSAVIGSTSIVVTTADGDAFGYESEGDIYVFGKTTGEDKTLFGVIPIISGAPDTIYIGKDFTNTYFYNAIYDIAYV